MGWIAVTGDGQNWIDPSLSARRMTGIDRTMRRGTILIETDAPTVATGPALIRLNRSGGAQGVMSLQWVPAMGIVLLVTQAAQVFHATLPLEQDFDRLQISFAWDLDRGIARLAAEDPATGFVQFAMLENPLPVFLSDFWSLSRGGSVIEPNRGLRCLAVSEAMEPIGPLPMLGGDTQVDTPDGPRAIETLDVGDTVRTLDGHSVPVLHVLRRTVPAAGSLAPLRLHAPVLGLEHDLTVAPGQKLVIAGGDVDYDYGADAVRLCARDLPGRTATRRDPDETGPLVTYHQLILPEGEALSCHGLAVESLNLGRLRRDGDLVAQSLLAGCARNHLPEHAPSPYPMVGASFALARQAEHVA